MACDAAIAEVQRMLPAKHPKGSLTPLQPLTPRQAFEKINWWTLPTIEEALVALVRRGEAESMQQPGGVVGYHYAPGRRARENR